MHALKLRSGSSEMVHKTSPKMVKGSPDSPESKPKAMERKSSNKSLSVPEKRIMRVSELQQQLIQLQEELKKVREERSQALEELAEAKKSQINEKEEAEKAKESERNMLESLISQTKQLEQTKISLEEAKLELRSLRQSMKIFEASASQSSRNLSKHLGGSAGRSSGNLGKNLEVNTTNDVAHAHEEIRLLRNELKSATAAEEKSKKAMDDLAIALQEVTTDANRTKGQLSNTQSELKSVRVEAERLEDLLKMTDEKFRAAVEESERVNMELEKSLAAWIAKENGFVDCMKVSEEEMSKAREENDKLISAQRLLREDNSKMRDILKHAVNEATVVKEAMEIARNENSQLKDILVEKDNSLQRIRQDYGGLKVSEAAALDSVRELKSLLAATSNVSSSRSANSLENGFSEKPKTATENRLDEKPKYVSSLENGLSEKPKTATENSLVEKPKYTSTGNMENGSSEQLKVASTEVRSRRNVTKFPSGNWNIDNPRQQNVSGNRNIDNPRQQTGRRHSVGEENKLKGSLSDTEGMPETKDRKLQSVSNMTELRVPSSLFSDDGRSTIFDDFDHIDRNQLVGLEHDFDHIDRNQLAGLEHYNGSFVKPKKKKPMLRRFGDMIRRRSFHK